MEKLKHTPGPWHTRITPHVNGESIYDRRGVHIAQVTSLGHDAELIARSPELADLLRRVAAIAPATSGADALALCDELETLQAEARILLTACS